MSWRREWLFTNSTRLPGGTVSDFGLTMPAAEMVIVNGLVPGEVGGAVLSPQAAADVANKAARQQPPQEPVRLMGQILADRNRPLQTVVVRLPVVVEGAGTGSAERVRELGLAVAQDAE